MAMTYSGVLLLSNTLFARLTIWPALALPILYNHAFAWGFLNYNFGIGVMLLAFALWLRIYRRKSWIRFVVLICISALLYLIHMLVFGLFAAIIGAHGLTVAVRRNEPRVATVTRELAIIVLPFTLVFLFYFLWQENDGLAGEKVTIYGGISAKIVTLLSPALFASNITDVVFFFIYISGGVYLALGKKLTLAQNMAFPLVLSAIICLAMPTYLFGVWGVDFRLPPVFLMLVIATTQPNTLLKNKLRPLATIFIIAVVLVRMTSLWPLLQQADRQFIEFKTATHQIPEGARVLVTLDDGPGPLALPSNAYWQLAMVTVIERNAFVPFLFTGATQVRPTPRNRDLDTPSGHPLSSTQLNMGIDPEFIKNYGNRSLDAYHRVYWGGWPHNFDYLVKINPQDHSYSTGEHLELIDRYSYFEIYKINEM